MNTESQVDFKDLGPYLLVFQNGYLKKMYRITAHGYKEIKIGEVDVKKLIEIYGKPKSLDSERNKT